MIRVNDDLRRIPAAAAQPMVQLGQVRANVKAFAEMVKQAAKAGAKLIVGSECMLTGYDFAGLGAAAAVTLDDRRLAPLAKLAKEKDIAIVAGLHLKQPEGVTNSQIAWLPDGQVVVNSKHVITGPDVTYGLLAGPEELTTIQWMGIKLGLIICADFGRPRICERFAEMGCDGVIVSTGGVGEWSRGLREADLDKPETCRQWMELEPTVCLPMQGKADARRLNMAFIAANQAGLDREHGYFQPGHCMIIDRNGEVTALIPGSYVHEHVHAKWALGWFTRRSA
ncbi:MAG: carbon-nitrogen hydrolase family protein [Phycisphaeraceae bacterium]|nr:carbon-nitrogen hydrolase family protein [Phycisphaeraceae bacterium]